MRLGGYPHGWGGPVMTSDDPEEAIARYERERARHAGQRAVVALFDRLGDGEPLYPDVVRDLVGPDPLNARPPCAEHPAAGPSVPFGRAPGINPVKQWFLNACLVRGGPDYDRWLANEESLPMAERAAACARLVDSEDGPPLVVIAWRDPAGGGHRAHGDLVFVEDADSCWVVERVNGGKVNAWPRGLTELEVVDA